MTTLVQLFSARDFLPWENVLDQIAQLGFDGVEGFFGNFDDPAVFRAALDARGLTMPQAHVPLALLEGDFAKALSIASTLGIHTLIAPWLPPDERPTDTAGWAALGARLNTIEGNLRAHGLRFAWHNHDFEMVSLPGGQTGMDILLSAAPGMEWEADLGWILRAGLNPVDWLHCHAGRIIAVHLKDLQPDHDAASESGWADLGHGVTDWVPIFAALAAMPRLSAHVAEHDNPADLGRFLSRWKVAQERLIAARPGQVFAGYAHATVMCRDLETQVAFYSSIMGLTEMFRMPLDARRVIVYLRITDGQYLELFSWGQGAAPTASDARGYHHICLQVADIDDSVATLRARGLRMCLWHADGSGLYETDEAAITVGLDGNRQSWLQDPEGNRIELMQMAPDSLQYQAIARLRHGTR